MLYYYIINICNIKNIESSDRRILYLLYFSFLVGSFYIDNKILTENQNHKYQITSLIDFHHQSRHHFYSL